MPSHKADPKHEAFYQDFAALLRKHEGNNMLPIEMLAVASNLLGKLVALQDQRVTTPAQAMEVVTRNLIAGNQQVIADLLGKTEGNS